MARLAHRSRRILTTLTGVGMVALTVFPAGAASADAGAQPFDAAHDTGSLWSITSMVGAQQLWDQHYTGAGVGVALIDTGVTRVPGLDGARKVFYGPDLSFDSQIPAYADRDQFGHGTHMASIIAGRDPVGAKRTDCATGDSVCLKRSAYSDPSHFEGVAPDAHIVSLKVGDHEGANDVTQVVAAIDWVVAHRNDPKLNIRVLNISYGTDSTQPAAVDPIAFAAENAWRHGIVVVAAAGNDGAAAPALADPAYSPMVVAVGASDPMGTLDPADDTIPDWANHGTSDRPVDVVAPGVHVAGLRVPGSVIDRANPSAVVGDRFFRGSGTSQAAAVVSGVAALLVDKYPTATPDQIKAMLRAGARAFGSRGDGKQAFRGRGSVDGSAAVSIVATPAAGGSDGSGSIEASRGSTVVADDGTELHGEQDIFGNPWNASDYVAAVSTDSVWSGGTWRGSVWAADGWLTFGRWGTSPWTGLTDWAGNTFDNQGGDIAWDGSRWSGSRWTGSRWSGSRWSGSRWSGSRWSGSRWSGSRWSDADWN